MGPGRLMSALFTLVLVLAASTAAAQDESDPFPKGKRDSTRYPNLIAGEFVPGTGFNLVNTKRGSLNVSGYGLFRWVNQYPVGDKFTDHLGRIQPVNPRNDINWHRTFAWLSGFFYDPKFLYTISIWALPTTQQTLIFGYFQFNATNSFQIGAGVGPNLTARSVMGSWPFWAAADRQMAEEFFRGGFSSSLWITGQVVPKLDYKIALTNNISELGVTQANDKPQMGISGTIRWQPTTGEFGPRNGFIDFEHHEKVATQFGTSGEYSRESRYAPLDQPPNNTQIRISDGLNLFQLGALADGVTVETANYNYLSFDAGAKYKGWAFQSEYYFRWLNNFVTNPHPIPLKSIYDNGFMAELSKMLVPKKLATYAATGYVFDQFRRRPWEASAGFDYYPYPSRSWRINFHYIHIVRSPTGSFFGYYTPGQTGSTYSIGTDFLF